MYEVCTAFDVFTWQTEEKVAFEVPNEGQCQHLHNASRFHPTVVAALKSRAASNLCQAFLQQEVSHRFIFTHNTYCQFICWLYGIGIRFSPNNLKRKARCGSDLLELYVQVNKIMQKLRKRKVCKHLKVFPGIAFSPV